MSKYQRIQTKFTDEDTLRQALADVCQEPGIQFEAGDALTLYGYRGDPRSERAKYVIRRRHIGRSANDVGFHRTDNGFEVIISEYDQRGRGAVIVREVKRRYARLQVEKLARARGMRVEEIEDNGVLRLQLYPAQSRRQPARAYVRR